MLMPVPIISAPMIPTTREAAVALEFTPELLRVFIRRIEVYEKFEKYSRTAGNPIRIHYAFRLPEQ
ncbi:MAG: DUF4368 domain-containing protein, partial [Clostridia bacterium]|nr:DUF4368 domain-containing protein [Clostridia bacterium]